MGRYLEYFYIDVHIKLPNLSGNMLLFVLLNSKFFIIKLRDSYRYLLTYLCCFIYYRASLLMSKCLDKNSIVLFKIMKNMPLKKLMNK